MFTKLDLKSQTVGATTSSPLWTKADTTKLKLISVNPLILTWNVSYCFPKINGLNEITIPNFELGVITWGNKLLVGEVIQNLLAFLKFYL